MPPYFFDELLELTETDIRDLTNSQRPYLGLLKMTFFSNNLLKLVLILFCFKKVLGRH